MTRPRNCVKVGALTFSTFIAELMEGPRTVAELADATGCHRATIAGYVKALRARGCMYIAGYEATRARTKLHALGKRPDAVRLPRRLEKETWQQRKRREAAQRLQSTLRLAA